MIEEISDNVRNALNWLDDEGWSELIDERWTLEVYYELQNSGLGLTDEEIRKALDIVIYEKPDYNPANNERLIRQMTKDSPKFQSYLGQMRQCKQAAETPSTSKMSTKPFFELAEPHEKADEILCNLIKDLGYEEIVEIYKSFDKWYA